MDFSGQDRYVLQSPPITDGLIHSSFKDYINICQLSCVYNWATKLMKLYELVFHHSTLNCLKVERLTIIHYTFCQILLTFLLLSIQCVSSGKGVLDWLLSSNINNLLSG